MYNSKKNFGDMEPSQMPIRKLNANEYDKETGNKLTDYKMICELGRGSFGVVHRVLSLVNGNEYVLKKINIKHMKANRQKEALKEAQILKKVRHNNIIKYYTSFVEQDYLYIIMEYAESGDLATLIKSHKEKRKPFTEKQIWDFASELCQALEYLHKNNIIHRDIKTLNIFLSRDGHIKLGDLGVSKIVPSAAAMQGTRVGTPLYLSPELVKQLPYDFKVDIWALGCVLYHLAALEAPFIGDNLISLGYNIVNKPPKPLSSAYSTQLTSLIMKFLEKSPTARPKLSEVWSYFPTKYRNANDNNNQNTSANKVEYHSNSVAQLLKIDEEIIVQNKHYKPLTHWISPDKRNSQIDLPARPFTANHLQGPHRDNLSPDKNSSKGSIRPQVYPIKANILSHNLNRNVSPARYTPNMQISSADEPRNRSPSLEKESQNQHVKKESLLVNNANKFRRISQKEAKVEPEDSSIEKAIAHRQSPTIEVVKPDNNQKFNSHAPIQRSQTTDMHKIIMNPLINSDSSRMKINSKLGQAPSLQGFFSKPGSDSVPYMSRPQTAQQKPQRNVEEKAFNVRDNEESDDNDSSDSLETLGNLRTKAYNGMRIRPISANNLVTMQNQLSQSIENKVPSKGLKTALSISTIEKEPKGETTITKIPESPKQGKQQYGGISPRNKSVSIERPKSAIGNIALNGQLQKEPTVGVENSPNSKYVKSGYGEWAFGRAKAQENSEKEKEKIAKFFQVSKLETNKPEGVPNENSEEKQGYDSAKKIDYKDLLKRNLVNTSLRLDAVAKSMMKNSIDVSRKNESVIRPTTAASSKKRLTIHDLM